MEHVIKQAESPTFQEKKNFFAHIPEKEEGGRVKKLGLGILVAESRGNSK